MITEEAAGVETQSGSDHMASRPTGGSLLDGQSPFQQTVVVDRQLPQVGRRAAMGHVKKRARPTLPPLHLTRLASTHGIIGINTIDPAFAMDHEPIVQPVSLFYGRPRLNLKRGRELRPMTYAHANRAKGVILCHGRQRSPRRQLPTPADFATGCNAAPFPSHCATVRRAWHRPTPRLEPRAKCLRNPDQLRHFALSLARLAFQVGNSSGQVHDPL